MGESRRYKKKQVGQSGFLRPARRPRPSRKRGWGLTGLLLVLAILGYVFLFGDNGYLRERDVRKEMAELENEISLLLLEGEELRADITELEQGGLELERVGREQLGLIKEGEISYRLVPAQKEGWALDR